MEFELVELPQTPDFAPRPLPVDPRAVQRDRFAPVRFSPRWHDQAVRIPDQESGS